jgi:hypothetical protein
VVEIELTTLFSAEGFSPLTGVEVEVEETADPSPLSLRLSLGTLLSSSPSS